MVTVNSQGLSRAKSAILALVRRGDPVTWTPTWMGFGNVLYLWMQAWNERESGSGRRVLDTPGMETWIETFPRLRGEGLTIAPSQVPFTARRDMPWKSNLGAAAYTSEQLYEFIRHFILSAPLFTEARDVDRELTKDRCLVVNVRRGDYYSNPKFESEFGFDQIAFLRAVIPQAVGQYDATDRIHVVSDGITWCQQNLNWLNEYAGRVTYASPGESPQQNLLTVASARRLVMTNSTFSYWCGYISGVIHGDNHSSIWAPAFFARFEEGGRSKQLDERWSIIEDIEGGWDRPYAP